MALTFFGCSAGTFGHIIEALKRFGVVRLGVSHCTGLPVAARLAGELGVFFNYAGIRTSLP